MREQAGHHVRVPADLRHPGPERDLRLRIAHARERGQPPRTLHHGRDLIVVDRHADDDVQTGERVARGRLLGLPAQLLGDRTVDIRNQDRHAEQRAKVGGEREPVVLEAERLVLPVFETLVQLLAEREQLGVGLPDLASPEVLLLAVAVDVLVDRGERQRARRQLRGLAVPVRVQQQPGHPVERQVAIVLRDRRGDAFQQAIGHGPGNVARVPRQSARIVS